MMRWYLLCPSGCSVYLIRGTSNKKALPTDQPNMQNFELASRSDDSASAGKKGVWPGTRHADRRCSKLPVSMLGAASRSS
jgi:hypothetical protein